jgi:hypothetical protein
VDYLTRWSSLLCGIEDVATTHTHALDGKLANKFCQGPALATCGIEDYSDLLVRNKFAGEVRAPKSNPESPIKVLL